MLNSDTSITYKHQWRLLVTLTAAHFVLDMFPGMMHTVLPALQGSFHLTVASGALLLTIFLVASNAIQVLIGHLRPQQEKPLLLYLGIVLTCSILLIGPVSKDSYPLFWLSLIAVAAGSGVGLAHPEGLRAVHRLEGITPAVSSSVFMGGGVFGFAFGGVLSTYLYERYGVMGMVPFCGLSLAVLAAMLFSGIKLATDKPQVAQPKEVTKDVPFWAIMGMAMLVTGSVQILMWIVPQHMSHIGAELTLGGKTVSAFTLAGGVGGIWWARSAARRGELRTIILMLACGIPFVGLYLAFMRFTVVSLAMLAAGGFFCFGAYPIMVSLARKSRGTNLGRRMGLIVGGIWLAACILPMILGPLAQRWGTGWILYIVPGGFVGALLLAIFVGKRIRN